ncbi:MAG: DUF507 family protein [Nitrospiraceae bacterium]|nr:DUF507 family protein [Nitrospiraceae bacterium]
MRIPKTWVRPMTERIIKELLKEGLVESAVPLETLVNEAEAIITDELTVEDRLNDEVRNILKKFEADIEKGRLDYKKMFDLTKQKLVKERNIVI